MIRNPIASSILGRIWSKISPLKTSAMAWRLIQHRLPTRVNLMKRNILPQNCNTNCLFCNLKPETAAHIFIECNVSSKIWYACYNWLSVLGAGHIQISLHFLSHSSILVGKKGNTFATSLWICIVWIIWKGRNKVIFYGKYFDLEKALDEIKGRFWSWCLVKYPSFCNYSFCDWLENSRKILQS